MAETQTQPTNRGHDGAPWVASDEVAIIEGITARGVRMKYMRRIDGLRGGPQHYIRRSRCKGGERVEFILTILDTDTQIKFQERMLEKQGGAEPEAEPQAVMAGPACEEQVPRSAQDENNSAALATSPCAQLAFALRGAKDDPQLAPVPEAKRPLASARHRIIQPMIDDSWKLMSGQAAHGIKIKTLTNYVAALAKDSGSRRGVLLDWRKINDDLRTETGDTHATVTPISAGSIWRFYSWYKHGRPRRFCSRCNAAVNQKTSRCAKCGNLERLPAGKEALQDLDRKDKGDIRLLPAHATFLAAAYTGGDATITRVGQALERPRSATECLDLLELEVNVAQRLPGPLPSYYQVRRWFNEFLPRIITDYARLGGRRALAQRGPKIPRAHAEQPNDLWYCDFRPCNLRGWVPTIGADGLPTAPLYRLYICGIADVGSRDMVICFDFHPSSGLFKSALRAALLRWGIPRQIWMDNGKEFTCEEISGGQRREWKYHFRCDEDTWSIFDRLKIDGGEGPEAHFCKKFNPNGKAVLERFFQNLDLLERNLPGWTGERTDMPRGREGARPERLKDEERLHALYLKGEAPETPLWEAQRIIAYETDWVEKIYRHRRHRGDGMKGRTPAQVQAAFTGERRIPNAEDLTLLLWHRRKLRARGDRVSFAFHHKTLIYRAEELLALPGDGEVEVHVDPLNADRAIALRMDGGAPIVLEPADPSGRTPQELSAECKRQAQLNRKIRQAALGTSRLAHVPGPDERLALLGERSAPKAAALAKARLDTEKEVRLPPYGEISSSEWMMRGRGMPEGEREEDNVETVDPQFKALADNFFKKGAA